MATRPELKNYTDFARFFVGRNLVVTILGSALAFVLSYIPETLIDFEYWGLPAFPPYRLSLTIAIILVVVTYTRNIASAGFVAIVGALGIVSPSDGSVDWFLGYLSVLLLLALFLGLLADRLRLVMNWVDFYLFTSLLFAIFLLVWGMLSNSFGELYWDAYELGFGGDIFYDTEIPLLDLILLTSLVFLTLVIMVLTQGERILDKSNTKKYKIFGYLFFLIGQALSIVSIIIFSDEITQADMEEISQNDKHLVTVGDILSHKIVDGYGIIVEPSNIFMIAAITTVFTGIGLSLLYIGKNEGNVDGMRGGSDVVFLAAPVATFLFAIIGSFQLQNFIDPEGFYISEELATMFAAMIWSVMIFNQLIARFILYILEKILPNK
ncbi:MAG: hypothetical protein ACXAD7_00925 [Candidatus Kariarchaeaceae archaeon]|jgi:hypothetical protein